MKNLSLVFLVLAFAVFVFPAISAGLRVQEPAQAVDVVRMGPGAPAADVATLNAAEPLAPRG